MGIGIVMGGIGEGLRQYGGYLEKSSLQEEMSKLQAMRDERMAEIQQRADERSVALREGAAVRADERRRAPYQRASERFADYEKAAQATLNPVTNDDEGNPLPRAALPERDRTRLLARAYEEEGLPEAAHAARTEALTSERLGVEKAGIDRRDAQDRRQHEERMQLLQKQVAVQERMLARQYKLDGAQSTALTTNIEFLVRNEIAKTPAEAFTMLRTRMEKSAEESVQNMTMQLLRSGDPRYRGKEGRQNALNDARNVVGKIRDVDEADFQRGFDRSSGVAAPRRPLDAFLGQ